MKYPMGTIRIFHNGCRYYIINCEDYEISDGRN